MKKGLIEEETLRSIGDNPPADTQQALPLRGWDRFHITQKLGEGGMGQVFQAHDPRLHRTVAIKLLSENNPRNLSRFVREARYQATVDHPHVCKVFEAGMVDGRAYIAMQHIQGLDLREACRAMDLERILTLFQQIAMGLHAAHGLGLIHRDIKPGNILVESPEKGPPHAYILDFGLARDQGDASMTRAGDILGTLAYMSPEQLAGELDQLDRRSDVYSLGASLYAVLSGAPPIEGRLGLEMLDELISGEIPPLRRKVSRLPRDIETMVMKCLEKNPGNRYTSALAFREDIALYLRGEPIRARPVSFQERLLKKARRHKPLVGTSLTALVLLLIALSWGYYGRHQASRQRILTATFSARVEKIQGLGRLMHLVPIHDQRRDRLQIFKQMDQIRAEMEELGSASVGPGNFALGQGYMELNDTANARLHLEKAWHSGFREPRIAYALAQVLGDQYRAALLAASRTKNPDQRARKKQEVQAQFRDPARLYARLGLEVDLQEPDYPEALIAFWEGDLDVAERILTGADQIPWFYETYQLMGDIYLERTLAQANADSVLAISHYQKAKSFYEQALKIAPSDPKLYLSLARLHYWRLLMTLYRTGDPEMYLNEGLSRISQALIVRPNWDEALLLKASFYRRFGEYHRNRARAEARQWFQQSLETCERLLKRRPDHSLARDHLGRAHSQIAQLEKAEDKDPSASLVKALQAFERVAVTDRDDQYFNNLGLVYKTLAEYNQRVGRPFRAHRRAEIAAYDATIERNGHMASPHINKASALLDMAAVAEHPGQELHQAEAALARALELAPEHVAAHLYLGRVLSTQARLNFDQGLAYQTGQERARLIFEAGKKRAPKLHHFPNALAVLCLDEARRDWHLGRDPEPALAAAVNHCLEAIRVAPDQPYGPNNLGEVYRTRAQYRGYRQGDEEEDLDQADTYYRLALRQVPTFSSSLRGLARIQLHRARTAMEVGTDPAPFLNAAAGLYEQAGITHPQAEFRSIDQAHLALTQARAAHRAGRDWLPYCKRAFTAFQTMPSKKLADEDQTMACARAYHLAATWLWEAGLDPTPYLGKGIQTAERVLSHQPLAEAQALRADLKTLLACFQKQEAAAVEAQASLKQALALNPNLAPLWSPRTCPPNRGTHLQEQLDP